MDQLDREAYELLARLQPAADATELNGSAFSLLTLQANKLGVAFEDLTLAQVAELLRVVRSRYNREGK